MKTKTKKKFGIALAFVVAITSILAIILPIANFVSLVIDKETRALILKLLPFIW